MNKSIVIGQLPGYRGPYSRVESLCNFVIEVNYGAREDGKVRLSICGNIGESSGGQNHDEILRLIKGEGKAFLPVADLQRLYEVWVRWHLNDMRAGCEHQRAEGWDKKPLYADQPLNAYVKHPDGHSGWNMLSWVPEKDGGLLSKPCAVCGYRFGSAWLHEDVPADVIAFLDQLGQNRNG